MAGWAAGWEEAAARQREAIGDVIGRRRRDGSGGGSVRGGDSEGLGVMAVDEVVRWSRGEEGKTAAGTGGKRTTVGTGDSDGSGGGSARARKRERRPAVLTGRSVRRKEDDWRRQRAVAARSSDGGGDGDKDGRGKKAGEVEVGRRRAGERGNRGSGGVGHLVRWLASGGRRQASAGQRRRGGGRRAQAAEKQRRPW